MNAAHTRLLARMVPALLTLTLSGCLIVPHKESRITGVVVPEKATQGLNVGEITRTDVLHMLGQPDLVEHDGRVFVYRWKMSSVFWVLILPGVYSVGAIGGDIPTADDFVLLEFDDAGWLRRIERVRDKGIFSDPEKTIQPWIAKGETSHPAPGPPP